MLVKLIPGRQPLVYFLCCGVDPRTVSASPKDFNYVTTFFQFASIVLHCVIHFKIAIFKLRPRKKSHNYWSTTKVLDNKAVGKWTLNLLLIICLVAATITSKKVNSLPFVEANLFPNYLYANIYLLVNPALMGCLGSIMYYFKNQKLRMFFRIKFEQCLTRK